MNNNSDEFSIWIKLPISGNITIHHDDVELKEVQNVKKLRQNTYTLDIKEFLVVDDKIVFADILQEYEEDWIDIDDDDDDDHGDDDD